MNNRFLTVCRVFFLVTASMLVFACQSGWSGEDRDFRQDMRDFVQAIGGYARADSPGFIVIPQNGHQLVTLNGETDGTPVTAYLESIDGIGREDLFFGYDRDDTATADIDRNEIIPFLDLAEASGVEIIVTDYCSDTSNVDESYVLNAGKNYTSFAADSRNLDTIPGYPSSPVNTHSNSVSTLTDIENFLYILDPSLFPTKQEYLSALAMTEYDLIIMDLFYEDSNGAVSELGPSDLTSIRSKKSGGDRLLICYMSIGEAEDYRYYWDSTWDADRPAWLDAENPNWKGNYKVQYWNADWQAIIFGAETSYLDKIIVAGFDGVYLDIIDAYEYFEG